MGVELTDKTMKLLTHNFLQSIVKGITKPYPLGIKSSSIETCSVDYSELDIQRMVERVEYDALLSALTDIAYSHNLPSALPETISEELLQQLHHVLFEIEIQEGCLAGLPLCLPK